MIKKLISAILLLVFLAVPVAAFETTGTMPESASEYLDTSNYITQITVLGTAEGFIPEFEDGKLIAVRAVGVFGQTGSCFYVGSHGNKHLFVTNAHVIKPAHVVIQENLYSSYITLPVRVISQIITVGQNTSLGSAPAELIWMNEEEDIAIVAVVGNWRALGIAKYMPVWTFYDRTSLIHEGDQVATIVAQRPNIDAEDLSKGPWFEVRYGKVLHNHPWIPEDCMLEHWFVAWFQLGDISTDLKIYPGDSGSPVFAFRNGQPVLIGIVRAAGWFQMADNTLKFVSYFTRIDSVMRFVLEK